ncbi:hypothetical protein [Pseudonocardia alni]|uniref:hypothetical protein n=1 Tax=Pseudonocardia alni TaxID=33907 RepID=UPI001AD7AAE4|nr:hypothetical protein [Pseudonocardia alni]
MTIVPDLGTLGAAHRAVWASAGYPAVAAELIPGLGEVVTPTQDSTTSNTASGEGGAWVSAPCGQGGAV